MSTTNIVGADCQISTILSLIDSSNNLALLHDKWSGIARKLGICSYRIKKLRNDLRDEKLTLMDVMSAVVEEWIARNGSDATLGKLINVFEQTSMNTCGELLRLQFNLPCKESENHSCSWEQLPSSFKEKVTKNLKGFWPDIELDEQSKSKLPRSILVDLMTGESPYLFKNTIPEELKYYLPRTLITRNVLTNKIFELTSGTFLVSGMERHELSEYLKKGQTDNSSNQLDNRDKEVRFMILDQPSHMHRIKSDTPVHLITFEANKFRCVRSRGPLALVHRCLHKSQDYLAEDEFLDKIRLLTVNNAPICISDSPGMGKSVLSKQIATNLKTLHPERTVIFQEFPEFIKAIENVQMKHQPLSFSSIKTALHNLICDNELEKAIFISKIKSEEVTVELILDGYDELSAASFKLADEFLKTAKSELKSVRLWITTRPHLLEKLENILGVLGYNIQAFTEADQIKFLTSFWARSQSRPLSTERFSRLTEFATECLKNLKSTISAKDEDIAGIPLQCLMIGEVYEEEATIQHASPFSGIKIIVGSITNLYQRTIEAKIRKYKSINKNSKLNERDLMDMHVQMSLELVFPMQYDSIRTMFRKIEIGDILNVGIVEHAWTVDKPRFIHRTFAEYFVAWFAVSRLSAANDWNNELRFTGLLGSVRKCLDCFVCCFPESRLSGISAANDWNDELNKLFFEGILGHVVKKSSHVDKFNNPIVCFFLNSLLSQSAIKSSPSSYFIETLNDSHLIVQIARVCVNSNLLHIFKMFDRLGAFKLHETIIFTADFVLDAIQKSEIQLVKMAITYFESHSQFEKDLQIKALRMAVKKGRFAATEFLLNYKSLREIIEDGPNWEGRQILHCCVEGSKENSEEVIIVKTQILTYLCKINRSLMEEENEENVTPLFCKNVHIKLLLKLLELNENLKIRIKYSGDTVLHISYLTPEEYLQLLKSIPLEKLKKLVREQGSNNETPLFRLIKNNDPNVETLEIFKRANADFNPCHYYENTFVSLLELAIIKGKSLKLIKKLIECGANPKVGSGRSLLHVAANYRNVYAIHALVDYNFSVNTVDYKNETALHCAAQNLPLFINIRTIEALIEHGIDVNARNFEGKTYLHFCLEQLERNSFDDVVEFLIKHKQAKLLNVQDKYGVSPLHMAVRYHSVSDNSLSLLQSNGVNFDDSVLISHAISNEANKNNLYSLIKFGADINWKGKSGESLLHVSALEGNLNAISFLVANNINVNSLDTNSETPLHYLAKFLSFNSGRKTIETLIENGADVNARNSDGKTYLHIYLELRMFKSTEFNNLFEYLIETNQAKLFNTQDKCGVTPLHLAVRYKKVSESTLSLLHSNSVKFNVIDNEGNSVLGIAINNGGGKNILSSLIRFGADNKWKGKSGEKLLHIAAKYTNLNAIYFLIANNLSVNAPDTYDETPLHYAAKYSSFNDSKKTMEILIKHGKDVTSRNFEGKTYLHLCLNHLEQNTFDDVVEFLIKHKQVKLLNVQDKYGVSPLHSVIGYHFVSESSVSLLHSNGVTFDGSVLCHAISIGGDNCSLSSLIRFGRADIKWKGDSGESLLHVAARWKNLNAINVLLANNLSINAVNKDNETPLHYAAKYSSFNSCKKTIETLIEHGADVSATNIDGKTYLHLCFDLRDRFEVNLFNHVVEFLIKQKQVKLLNVQDKYGVSPLHLAVGYYSVSVNNLSLLHSNGVKFGDSVLRHSISTGGDRSSLSSFIRFGADIDWKGESGESHLHVAARCGNLNAINLLLANNFSVNALDINNETPLHHAARHRSFDIRWKAIKTLIEHGVDVNATNVDGKTYLHIYLECRERTKFDDLVEFLIKNNQAKLFNVQDKFGVTPLHVAVRYHSVSETSLCLLHSIDVKFDSIDNHGDSLLTYSMMEDRNTNLLSPIIHFGADPKKVNKYHQSLLHISAQHLLSKAVERCIALHLDVNGKDKDGNTPLHLVLLTSTWRIDRLEITKLLVKKGAKLDIQNKDGLIPLEIARRPGSSDKEIIKYLSKRMMHLEKGTKTWDGNTELHIAVKLGDVEQLEKLVKEGVDVNAANKNLETSLHMAAYKQDTTAGLEIIKFLLDNEANPFRKNINDATCLHIFLSNNLNLPPSEFHDLVEYLVGKNYAKLLDTLGMDDKSTPLQAALFNISVEERTLNLLSSNGVELSGFANQMDSSGNNLLHIAAKHGNLATLNIFLQLGIKINDQNSDGNTPFHLALLSGGENVAGMTALLLMSGADANILNNSNLSPVLILAQKLHAAQ